MSNVYSHDHAAPTPGVVVAVDVARPAIGRPVAMLLPSAVTPGADGDMVTSSGTSASPVDVAAPLSVFSTAVLTIP
jgi:hypothetical protein